MLFVFCIARDGIRYAEHVLLFFFFFVADINKCLTGAHNCSSDAACNNTKGTFYCTCSPGFTGDGQNCTGNDSGIFRLFPLKATLIM